MKQAVSASFHGELYRGASIRLPNSTKEEGKDILKTERENTWILTL